jgi:hypothetical protein
VSGRDWASIDKGDVYLSREFENMNWTTQSTGKSKRRMMVTRSQGEDRRNRAANAPV